MTSLHLAPLSTMSLLISPPNTIECESLRAVQDKAEPPVYVSDRRFMKSINLLQVAAHADGRDQVLLSPCSSVCQQACTFPPNCIPEPQKNHTRAVFYDRANFGDQTTIRQVLA